MSGQEFLADQFEAHRAHLRAVAYRLLGSHTEADDAVQEAWLRLSRTDTAAVDNLGGWLTTVVARVSLNMLRSRSTWREEPLEDQPADSDPEQEAVLADSVSLALLVVLDRLSPAERLAFVLHDLFAVPFDEIAVILDRAPAATRQLASRARRRVQGAEPTPDLNRQREVIDAFLAASRDGDFDGLLALLDPDVVVRSDTNAIKLGATAMLHGADDVASTVLRRARGVRPALVGGIPGAVAMVGAKPLLAFHFTVVNGKIMQIELLADPDRLATVSGF
jgi:RNA polymerase sigma-70 factor (ECF subfamily)